MEGARCTDRVFYRERVGDDSGRVITEWSHQVWVMLSMIWAHALRVRDDNKRVKCQAIRCSSIFQSMGCRLGFFCFYVMVHKDTIISSSHTSGLQEETSLFFIVLKSNLIQKYAVLNIFLFNQW